MQTKPPIRRRKSRLPNSRNPSNFLREITLTDNPVLDFGVEKSAIRYIGSDLQRPECILAEPDGTLWSADARGGVARITPDGKQEIITQHRSSHFQGVTSETSRYLEGTLPNGLAFARNGDILISNFGTDCLEPISRDGATMVLADSIDGRPAGFWHEDRAGTGGIVLDKPRLIVAAWTLAAATHAFASGPSFQPDVTFSGLNLNG